MDNYLSKIATGGKGYIEYLNDIQPSWTIEDQGRLVYNLQDSTLYFGSETQWVVISSLGWLDRLLPSGGTAGQALTKSSPSAFDVNWSTVAGGGTIAIDQNPVGTIIAWPSDTVPTGFLDCEGQAVSRSTYSELFGVIGTRYGRGNNTTTFNLPDYRGYFLRGYDGTAGNDPDKNSRTTSSSTGGGEAVTGNNVGTKQTDEFKSHNHESPWNYRIGVDSDNFGYGALKVTTPQYPGEPTKNTGGNESRPKNVYVKFCIKYMLTAVQEIPPGSIVYSASQGTPAGFEKCDGTTLSRSIYSELYNSIGLFFSTKFVVNNTTTDYCEKLNNLGDHVIHSFSTGDEVTFQTTGSLPSPLTANTSYWVRKIDNDFFTIYTSSSAAQTGGATGRVNFTTYGNGNHYMDLSTSFKVPDLRGSFVRTVDSGIGIDQDRIFGSYQEDMFQTHKHSWNNNVLISTVDSPPNQSSNYLSGNGGSTSMLNGSTIDSRGYIGSPSNDGVDVKTGDETRPKNFALNAFIKW